MSKVTAIRAAQPVPPVTGVTVELSLEEVKVLKTIFNSIGGSPSGPRGVVDAISDGLLKATGIGSARHFPVTGSIYFD